MELLEFLAETQQNIREETLSKETEFGEGMAFPELIFTEIVANHMLDVGMTFQPIICHVDATVGSYKLKLSGYAISDDADQLDLYVSLYKNVDEITSLPDSETIKAATFCSRFLENAVQGKLTNVMDESHEAYPLVLTIEQLYEDLDQIRIYVLTDCQTKSKQFKAKEVKGKTIRLEVMDIERLYNHTSSGKPRDELVVNFEDSAGVALPCVWVPNDAGDYDYGLTAIPGETLRFLYDKYGPRILEANVRSFLMQTGKVNKGIRDTLKKSPERFMAYNNGIVMIADEISFKKSESGIPGISWLKGIQIVNGGQTTASMYFSTKKDPKIDLSHVRVPVKLIVLRKTNEKDEEQLIADISKYANSQNVVKTSDLSANKPYHVAIEKRAMRTFCPDGVSRWFYERATGSYKVLLEREGKTPAGIRKLKERIPPARKITKTDLAKFLCAWEQRPDIVSTGGQKNFKLYMEMIDAEEKDTFEMSVNEYKEMIAKVIIFKEAYKVIRPRFPAFQANVVAYTISILSKLIEDKINFELVWNDQKISKELKSMITIWADEVNEYLHLTANGRMVSEWAKKEGCWLSLKVRKYSAVNSQIPELK